MHPGHEDMEMDARLGLYRGRLKEQVHEHGLATADRAPKVDASLAARLAEQTPAVGRQIAFQPRQGLDGGGLAWIGLDRAPGQSGLIGGAHAARGRAERRRPQAPSSLATASKLCGLHAQPRMTPFLSHQMTVP